jgi:hypothetical protein
MCDSLVRGSTFAPLHKLQLHITCFLDDDLALDSFTKVLFVLRCDIIVIKKTIELLKIKENINLLLNTNVYCLFITKNKITINIIINNYNNYA